MADIIHIDSFKPKDIIVTPEKSDIIISIDSKFDDKIDYTDNSMNHPNDIITSRELDAKLEAIEARMDARVTRIEDTVNRIEESNKELRKDIRSSKWQIILTFISTGIAIAGLLYAIIQAYNTSQQAYLISLDNRIGYINSKVDDLDKPKSSHTK